MLNIQTLQHFLETSGAQTRIFDLGRRVTKIDKSSFLKIENCQIPYPYPLQRHAWFGVLFWDPKNTNNHHVWFLKLPLDEQGYLDLNARDDFLRRALAQLGQTLLDNQDQQGTKKELKDNPWSYMPREDKMATFHAKALVELGLPGSQFLAPFLAYLQQSDHSLRWQQLGFQGIADICARSDQPSIQSLLTAHLSQLPSTVQTPLLLGLENETISHELTQAVIHCKPNIQPDSLTTDEFPQCAAIIRALSGSVDRQSSKTAILAILDGCNPTAVSIEILVAISGRSWNLLEDDAVALRFIEALSHNDVGQEAFNQVLTDLLFIPTIGKCIRQAFRSPDRSEVLGNAIGNFLSGVH